MNIIYYDKWQDVDISHMRREMVADRVCLTNDPDERVSIALIQEKTNFSNPENTYISISYEESCDDYYTNTSINGLYLEFDRMENDVEYASRIEKYQKRYMKKHKRPTPTQLAKIEAARAAQEKKDRKEYDRLKKIFG